MNGVNLIVGLSDMFSGILIVFLSLPLVQRKVKMNRIYGFRFRSSFLSDESWYSINEYGGRIFALFGGALTICGICCLLLPIPEGISVYLAFAPVLAVVPGIITYRFGKKTFSDSKP